MPIEFDTTPRMRTEYLCRTHGLIKLERLRGGSHGDWCPDCLVYVKLRRSPIIRKNGERQ